MILLLLMTWIYYITKPLCWKSDFFKSMIQRLLTEKVFKKIKSLKKHKSSLKNT